MRNQRVPPLEQDAIIAMILDELADEERWSEAFAKSQTQLAKLAEKVHRDVQAGRFRTIDFAEI